MKTIKELRKIITEPSQATGAMKENAILRLWEDFAFIEYPRSELIKVFDEFESRVFLISSGLEEATALDRFIVTVLYSMAAESLDKKGEG